MKNLNTLLFLAAVLVLASCSSVKVVSDSDKTVDFSQYKTFEFLGWQDDSDKMLTDLDKSRLRDAFKTEFDSREMTYVEEGGDMAISLFLIVDQKTSTTAYTNYYGAGGYGYGYRYSGWGWGGGNSTTTYSEYEYEEGTLIMNAFDTESKKMIWQGIATGTVEDNPAKREKSTPKAINALMKEFPIEPKE